MLDYVIAFKDNVNYFFHGMWQKLLCKMEQGKNKDYVSSKFGFYFPSTSQGHIGTRPQHYHLWDLNQTEVTPCD